MKISRLALAFGSKQDGGVCGVGVACEQGITSPQASPSTKSKAGGHGKADAGAAALHPS